jgi:hypothetical protein
MWQGSASGNFEFAEHRSVNGWCPAHRVSDAQQSNICRLSLVIFIGNDSGCLVDGHNLHTVLNRPHARQPHLH